MQSNKQAKDIFRDILWNEIDTFLKASDPNYQKGDDSALYNWVKNKFDNSQMRRVGLNTTYDFYFVGPKTIEEILNISKTNFEIRFRKEISSSLSINGQKRSPLAQVVHYFLLVDMIKRKLFAPIESRNYKDAKSFVDSYYLNYEWNYGWNYLRIGPNVYWNNFANHLSLFLRGLKEQVTKFSLNWETKGTPYGLVFERDAPHKLLTPQDDTNSVYDFKFKFRFTTNYVDESTQNSYAQLFKFNIPMAKKLVIFKKLKILLINLLAKALVENKAIWINRFELKKTLWIEFQIWIL